jgi:hypothetical protein
VRDVGGGEDVTGRRKKKVNMVEWPDDANGTAGWRLGEDSRLCGE